METDDAEVLFALECPQEAGTPVSFIGVMIMNRLTHGLNQWMVLQTFYVGLNHMFKNLLDSTGGGTFMASKVYKASW